jgi:hypothetical protein
MQALPRRRMYKSRVVAPQPRCMKKRLSLRERYNNSRTVLLDICGGVTVLPFGFCTLRREIL